LTVWNGTIIDGHNRYAICRELNLPFGVRAVDFENVEAAMDWIDANQLARRNLTPDAFRLALGRRYNRVKKAAHGREGRTFSGGQSDHPKTAERLAKEHGVDERTVRRAAKFAEEVAREPEFQKAIREGTPIAKIKKEQNRNVRRERIIAETREAIVERPRIIHADCLSILESIPPIDLLLTDPPYFTDGDFTGHVSRCFERLQPTAQAYVFASADPEEIAAYLTMDRHGVTLEQILVWNYNNTGQRQPNDRYNSNFQVVFYFRGPKAPSLNKPSDGTHQYACQTVNAPDGRIGDRFHEWQKPMELVERYIRNSSQPGQFVFDPFAGTGTTILAAAKLGRKAIGCDTDEETIRIAIERGCVE
jgi:DNA modification methylase